MFGDIAGMQLGAAVDVGAVALHDDSELHCAEGSGSSPESSLSDPASAGPSSKSVSAPRPVRRLPWGRHAAALESSETPAPRRPSAAMPSPGVRPRPPRRPRRLRRRRRAVFDSLAGSVGLPLRALARCRRPLPRPAPAPAVAPGAAVAVTIAPAAVALDLLRLARRPGAGPVLDDAFQRPRAALVEIHPARQRFQPHLEVLDSRCRRASARARGCAPARSRARRLRRAAGSFREADGTAVR